MASATRSPDLRDHLMAQPKERLVGWMLEQAARDNVFQERLKLNAAAANPSGVDMDNFRRRIDKALDFPEMDDEEEYDHYYDEGVILPQEHLDPILKALEKVLAQGHAVAVASLAEYALTEYEKVARRLEYDPDGAEEIAHKLCALHVKAAKIAKPDLLAMGEWVFNRALGAASSYGGFPWKSYRPLLGPNGLERFRARVEAAWSKLPSKDKGSRYHETSNERNFLKQAMAFFAENAGDVDARVAVERKDLSSPDAYLQTARIYHSAKRHDEALSWAEKGWRAFPDRFNRHEGLRTFLASEYRRRKRIGDAMDLYWDEFECDPGLHTYLELKKQADLDRAWPMWRKKAITHLRATIETASKKVKNAKSLRDRMSAEDDDLSDASRLVEILLEEKDPEAAWQAAVENGCSDELWLELSKTREKERPADCIPIWQRRVERYTRDAHQFDYVPAAEALKKLGQLLERVGKRKEYIKLMGEIRQTRRIRRKFIAELDKRRLP